MDSLTPPIDVKQVIVVRRDLHMRQGKAVAQGAHAAMWFILDACANSREFEPQEKQWFSEGVKKIVVRVDSEAEIQSVIESCRAAGLRVFPITDAGLTEFHGVPTLTCCAIGPDYSDKIDVITGHLKLL